MRVLALVISLLATWPVQALAQPQAAEAAPNAAEAPTAETIDAARQVMQALTYDSGVTDGVLGPMMALLLPELRSALLDSPLYLEASPRGQAALITFVDALPALLREEVDRGFAVISDRASRRLAQRMTAEELNGLAALMRQPGMTSRFQRLVREAVEGAPPSDHTAQEVDAMAAFMETPAGAAYAREAENIHTILREEFEAGTARMRPQLRGRVLSGMCGALGDECPERLRRMVNET